MSLKHSKTLHIIGHGLAGAILSETASAAGYAVRVSDDGGPSSSRVAAGLYTPLTGKRLAPSWSLEPALSVLNRFYPALEQTLGVRFFHPLPTTRILVSPEEQSDWQKRQPEQAATLATPSGFEKEIRAFFNLQFGAFDIPGSGWVDLPTMLDALRSRREQRGEWGPPNTPPELTLWAEGARAAHNPLWRDLGWRNAHGDILTLRIPDLPPERIYNFGRFLLPIGDGLFRCGATYTWDIDSPAPRSEGRSLLESELRSLLKVPFQVVGHQAGIRPVAIARVPVAGPHPEAPGQWILNGFGSKGVLYAPWMAERLIGLLLNNDPLPKECQATRRMQRQRDRNRQRTGTL
ncbi:MAG: FAD-dependent oxidoreductase [Kiritimatiellae bacterium]|jgi:glycine/D-amino acid oxidase-like deaminating enzyme|nr:FAD-dependent oxidoreductase [Kiritimatiellia bacterium]